MTVELLLRRISFAGCLLMTPVIACVMAEPYSVSASFTGLRW
jgi:hypothetical protein